LLVTGRYSVQISVETVAGVVSVTTRHCSVARADIDAGELQAGLLAMVLAD
jgi:hypothetical protein